MSGVISVERFSITLSTAQTSNQAALTKGQVTANSVPFVTKYVTTGGGDDWSRMAADVYFSGSNVVVERTNSGDYGLTVEVTVVEFDPTRVTVQSGTFTLSSSSVTASITAANLSNSFLIHNYRADSTGDDNDDNAVRGRITSTTQLTFDRDSTTGTLYGHWYVIESDEADFSVQPLSITMTETSATGTITAVTLNKTFLIGSFYGNGNDGDDNDDGSIMAYISSTTQVTLTRDNSSGTIQWSGFVVSFAAGGSETVQRGEIIGQGAVASQNVDITAVDLDVAMVHCPGNSHSFKNASFPGESSSDVSDALVAWDFVDSDTIRVRHNTYGGEADNDISWEVIEWGVNTPIITDVNTDETYSDEDTAVPVTGQNFGATKGTGKLEVGDSAVYATSNLIEQTTTSWSDTSIQFTADLGSQSPGTKWMYVTNDDGFRSEGFEVFVYRKHAFEISLSDNIAASGENTTAQLTPPAGKTTGDFIAGRIQDDENPADSVNLTEDSYTELEWCMKATEGSQEVSYDFRVTCNGVPLSSYPVIPQLTVTFAVDRFFETTAEIDFLFNEMFISRGNLVHFIIWRPYFDETTGDDTTPD